MAGWRLAGQLRRIYFPISFFLLHQKKKKKIASLQEALHFEYRNRFFAHLMNVVRFLGEPCKIFIWFACLLLVAFCFFIQLFLELHLLVLDHDRKMRLGSTDSYLSELLVTILESGPPKRGLIGTNHQFPIKWCLVVTNICDHRCASYQLVADYT